MVLVDTSVWIRFLADRAPHAAEVERLIVHGEVIAHDLVYGELLIGDKGGRRKFFASYDQMRRAVTLSHADVVAFVRNHRLHGRGVGWIDVHLLASALVDGSQLWTSDSRLQILTREFGVAFTPRTANGRY